MDKCSPFPFLLERERNNTFTLLGTTSKSQKKKKKKIYVQENVCLILVPSTHSELRASTVLGAAKKTLFSLS